MKQTIFLLWIAALPWTMGFGQQSLFDEAHELMKPNTYTRIDSMLIYFRGDLVYEQYYGDFGPEKTHRAHSTFKSITALLTLIAIDQGLMTLNEPVLPLVSSYLQGEWDDKMAQIQVIHLLNMVSGLDCDEAPGSDGPNHEWGVDEGPNPLKYSLSIPLRQPPGTMWKYCNANSYLLGVAISGALKRAGREDIFAFANQYLMAPLGIQNYRLTHSMNRQFINGQGNAHFNSRDLAKFGLLLLNRGNWQGKQIIQENSLKPIFNPKWSINWSFLNGDNRGQTQYAFQWYTTFFELNHKKIKSVHSWGNGGQFIFVVPQLDLVALFTGSNQGNFEKQKQAFEIMERFVLPEVVQRAELNQIAE